MRLCAILKKNWKTKTRCLLNKVPSNPCSKKPQQNARCFICLCFLVNTEWNPPFTQLHNVTWEQRQTSLSWTDDYQKQSPTVKSLNGSQQMVVWHYLLDLKLKLENYMNHQIHRVKVLSGCSRHSSCDQTWSDTKVCAKPTNTGISQHYQSHDIAAIYSHDTW